MKFLKKRNKSGFTLMELIIAMAVASILFLGITTTLLPSIKFFQQTSRWASDKSASNTIYKYVSERLRFSSDLFVYEKYDDADFETKVKSDYLSDSDYFKDRTWKVIKIRNDSPTGKGRLQVCDISYDGTNVTIGSFTNAFADEYYSERDFDITMKISSTFEMEIIVTKDGQTTHKSENKISLMNYSTGKHATYSGAGINNYYVYCLPLDPTEADGVDGTVPGGGGGGGGDPTDPTDPADPGGTPTTPTNITLEAEDANVSSGEKPNDSSASGGKYAEMKDGTIEFTIPSGFVAGDYKVTIITYVPSGWGDKTNSLYLNSTSNKLGDFVTKNSSWSSHEVKSSVSLSSGDKIILSGGNKWIMVDCIILEPVSGGTVTEVTYTIKSGDHGKFKDGTTEIIDTVAKYGDTVDVKISDINIDTDFAFDHWKTNTNSNISTSGTYTFKVTESDNTIEAVYKSTKQYTYSVDANGGVLDSSSTAGGSYNSGVQITASVTAPSGYTFKGWYKDGVTQVSTSNPYTFNISANTSLKAMYNSNGSGTPTGDSTTLTLECEDYVNNYKDGNKPTVGTTLAGYSGTGYAALNNSENKQYIYVPFTAPATDKYSFKISFSRPSGSASDVYIDRYDSTSGANHGQQSYEGKTYYHNYYSSQGSGSSSSWTAATPSGLTTIDMNAGDTILIGLTDNKGRAYFDKIVVTATKAVFNSSSGSGGGTSSGTTNKLRIEAENYASGHGYNTGNITIRSGSSYSGGKYTEVTGGDGEPAVEFIAPTSGTYTFRIYYFGGGNNYYNFYNSSDNKLKDSSVSSKSELGYCEFTYNVTAGSKYYIGLYGNTGTKVDYFEVIAPTNVFS